jgi:mono/diheme cytochrome c family protein
MNARLIIPTIALIWVVAVSATLIGIILLGPYTHGNLAAEYQPAYVRTEQILVGPAAVYDGPGLDSSVVLSDNPVTRGSQLLIAKGCATCHGLDGDGGPAGVQLKGHDASFLRMTTSRGPHGMPKFNSESLTDDDLAAIAAYVNAKAGEP